MTIVIKMITESSWQVISLHFPQKLRPFKYVRICKRTKIHSVSSSKFGGIRPCEQPNRVHFRVYFNPSATCFTFRTYNADNKANLKIMKLNKIFLRWKGSQTPSKIGQCDLNLPHELQIPIFDRWSLTIDKYQITYQNIWEEGVVSLHLVELDHYKILDPVKGVPDLNHFRHKKRFLVIAVHEREFQK